MGVRKTWEIREYHGMRFFEVVKREYWGEDTPNEDWWPDQDPDVILPFVSSPNDPPLSDDRVGRTVDWFKFQAYSSIRDG